VFHGVLLAPLDYDEEDCQVKLMRSIGLALATVLVAGAFTSAAGQSAVTSAEIQRLQNTIHDATRDLAQTRTRDQALASQLEGELDDASDEAIYLKVKLRKNEPVAWKEYSELRDRVEGVRSRARGDAARAATPATTTASEAGIASVEAEDTRAISSSRADVPVGTEFDVRLQKPLSSETAQIEDRFEATTIVDYSEGDRVVVPAGSVMRGWVSSVTKAGRLERKGSLTVVFDQLTINGRSYPMRGTVTQAIEGEGIKGETARIGTGAGVGAIIGGILGGFKGALAGILIGGGGTIAATEGKEVELPQGAVLRVRIDSPLQINNAR
jgi:hypothetical protein